MRLPISDFYLAPFPSYGSSFVKFSLATEGRFNALAGVIPCEYPDKLYLSRN